LIFIITGLEMKALVALAGGTQGEFYAAGDYSLGLDMKGQQCI
jgi:hypothetical protein